MINIQNMVFLVTGGAGYIGSHMTYRLIEDGHQVIVLDNLSTGSYESIHPKAEFIQGDIGDADLVNAILKKGVDAVFHFAAFVRVEESVQNPGKYYENNTAKALTLIRAVADFKHIKFIFSSTAAVYGASEGIVSEESPTKPLNSYGHSKLLTEQILKEMSLRHGFKSVVLRYFNVAGSRLDGKIGQRSKHSTHLIKVASEVACKKRNSISIFGVNYPTPDGTCIRDFIHVEDLCEAHILALKYLENNDQEYIFNLGYGHGYSVRQVIAEMKKISQFDFQVEECQARPGDNVISIANSSKAFKVLNWKPRLNDLNLICKSAFDFEKKLESNYK